MLLSVHPLDQLRSRCTWPQVYYHTVDQLIALKRAKNILEVGVAYGLHAEHMLNKFPSCTYLGIDPYIASYDTSDAFAFDVHNVYSCNSPQESFDNLYHDVVSSLRRHHPFRHNILRGSLPQLATSLPAHFFDLIFVDGDHRYESVIQDLSAASALLSPGGILCGDDYNWPSVEKAVLDFAAINGQSVMFIHSLNDYKVWYYGN